MPRFPPRDDRRATTSPASDRPRRASTAPLPAPPRGSVVALGALAPALAPALVTGLTQKALDLGTKALGAGVLWIVGRFVIRSVKRALERSLRARSVEATLVAYAESVTSVLLNILLVAIILGFVGVETTTFAGLLAVRARRRDGGRGCSRTSRPALSSSCGRSGVGLCASPGRHRHRRRGGHVRHRRRHAGERAHARRQREGVGDTIENFTTNPFRRKTGSRSSPTTPTRAAMAAVRARVAALPHVLATPPSRSGC